MNSQWLRRLAHREEGMTLIELMTVATIAVVLLTAASVVSSQVIDRRRADSSTLGLVNALETARTRAIAERRNFHIDFQTSPYHALIVQRINLPNNTLQTVAIAPLDNGFEFRRFSGIPDTPDLFGGTGAVNFGNSPRRMFSPSAMFVDQPENVLNGTIFIGKRNEPLTARAVTIFGVTGLIRVWQWTGREWVE
jgi:prepilin-type N-terminal cleavage/methylation domain-containing protein